MEEKKKGFWKNFTRKNFLMFSFWLFVFNFSVSLLVNFLYPEDTVRSLFTVKELISRSIAAMIIGLLLSIWIPRHANHQKKL